MVRQSDVGIKDGWSGAEKARRRLIAWEKQRQLAEAMGLIGECQNQDVSKVTAKAG